MPRPQLAKEYRNFIQQHANSPVSNRKLAKNMEQLFTREHQAEIGQTTPSETTIRNYRAEFKEPLAVANKILKMMPPATIDRPWRSKRIDLETQIPPYVGDWISTKLFTNNYIMKSDGVSHRMALWITTLFDRLREEEPLLVWSIAWLYANHERFYENLAISGILKGAAKPEEDFDTRPFDCYVAIKPWKSFANQERYDQAVMEGITQNMKDVSPLFVTHEMQIWEIQTRRWSSLCENS